MKCDCSKIYSSLVTILFTVSGSPVLSVLALDEVNSKKEINTGGVDSIGASLSVNSCPEVQALESNLLLSNSRINELIDELKSAQFNISQHLVDIKAKELEAAGYQKQLVEVKSDLADAIAERNDSFQHSMSLQEKIDRMESECIRILNETDAEIESLRRDLEVRKRQAKSAEERYHDTRKKVVDLEGELQQMHKKAVSKYVNLTLIQSDAWYLVERIASKTVRNAEKRWGRHYYSENSSRLERCKRAVGKAIMVADLYISKSMGRLYRTIVSMPVVKSVLIETSQIVNRVYSQHEDNINELVEALRLSAVSAIEEFSKAVINLLDESVKKEEEKRKRRMERKKDPVHRHKQTVARRRPEKKLDLDEEDGFLIHDDHFEPSTFHLKSKVLFGNILRNSENLAERAFEFTPLFLSLLVTNNIILGVILFNLGISKGLIWLICVIKVIWRSSKQTTKSSQTKDTRGRRSGNSIQ
mmetsp:Transcript_9581/g.20099  ORF Transcript_9581/g.20099 Transcript_9581/m.20099 type:complete len:472 (-) Transcript_9581:26-1441(-)